MKLISKILLFTFSLVLLSQCEKEVGQKTIKIPDKDFLNALIQSGVDKDGDGIISHSEAESVIYLYLEGHEDSKITSLDGIEAFINLDSLYCSNNNLSTIDLSSNTELRYLNCSGNHLTNLDISNNCLLITIAGAFFLLINFLFYKTWNVYYKKEYGEKMWKLGGVRVYFWQASIFVSTAGTVLIMYLLKWSNVLTF